MDGRRRKTVHAARRPEERPKDASHSSTFTECTAAMLTLPSFAGPTSARSVTRTVRMRFSVGTLVWGPLHGWSCGDRARLDTRPLVPEQGAEGPMSSDGPRAVPGGASSVTTGVSECVGVLQPL